MTKPVIAIIGAGNMGGSLIRGLINQDYPPQCIIAVDPDSHKVNALQKQFNLIPATDVKRALSQANIVLLAVKPNVVKEVAMTIKAELEAKKRLIISIAAGITLKNMETWFGKSLPIIRAMPNMPAMIGCGVTGLIGNKNVSKADKFEAEEILGAVGTTFWLKKEALLNIVTALSGSGPAYFFMIMEALEQSATDLGLPEDISHQLTLHTAYGAALMAIESDIPLATLRQQITSPGGTTEKALAILEENKLKDILKATLTAAKKRSEELSQESL